MNLRVKLSILIMLLAITPLLLVTYLGYLNQREALQDKSIEQLISIAELQERRINETLDRYLEQLVLISSRTQLKKSLLAYSQDQLEEEMGQIFSIISDANNSSLLTENVTIFDLAGGRVSTTNSKLHPENVFEESFFQSGLRSSQLFDIVKNDQNILSVQLVGPLHLDGEVIGMMEIHASANLIFGITEDYSGLGKTGETLIGKKNKQGDALFLTPLRFDAGAALSRGISSQISNSPIIQAIGGDESVVINRDAKDYRGETVLAVTRYVDALDWGVVVKIDRDEAFAPILDLTKSYISIVGLAAVLIVLISVAVVRKIVDPIRYLTLFAENLQAGNFSMRTEVLRDDEVGILAAALNQMASRLNDVYVDLEKQVKERTSKLTEALQSLEVKNSDLSDAKLAMMNILEDVEAEKVRAEKQVQETQKFKQAVDSSTDGIIISLPDMQVVYVNQAWEHLTGYSQEEVIGKKPSMIQSGKTPKEVYEKMTQALQAGESFSSEELINKRKDGSEYSAALSIVPIRENDKTIFYVGVQQDISKRKQVDKAKTEFVSLASHQLRTPLSAIGWYTEMLLAGDAGPISDSQRQYLDEVYRGNKRMVGLVNALLNVSRIELGTFAVDPEMCSIETIINDIHKELHPKIEQKQMRCTLQIAEGIPDISADPKLLTMIIQNLYSNAVKYTPEGGTVIVSANTVNKGDMFGGKQMEFDSISLAIKDSGLGIPREQHGNILFRADNVKETDAEGTGLGLYIVKAVLEQTGGAVWFESAEGQGATFYVIIPKDGMKKKEGTKKLS